LSLFQFSIDVFDDFHITILPIISQSPKKNRAFRLIPQTLSKHTPIPQTSNSHTDSRPPVTTTRPAAPKAHLP